MREIITIQHTQSEQHLNQMIGSWFDWELTPLGIDQANNMANTCHPKLRQKSTVYSRRIY